VPVIEEYAVPAVVEYLQVADSLVARDIVVCVVPAVNDPVGCELDLVGAVVSAVANVFPEAILDNVEMFPESSVALMAK
jgi:hypothetical protein